MYSLGAQAQGISEILDTLQAVHSAMFLNSVNYRSKKKNRIHRVLLKIMEKDMFLSYKSSTIAV